MKFGRRRSMSFTLEDNLIHPDLDVPVRRSSRLDLIPEEVECAYKRRMALIIQTPISNREELDFKMLENEYENVKFFSDLAE